jgi:hypothetical protein
MEGPSDERRNDSAGWRKEPVFEWFFLPVFERVEHLAEYLADFECFRTSLQLLRDWIWPSDAPVYRFSQCSQYAIHFIFGWFVLSFVTSNSSHPPASSKSLFSVGETLAQDQFVFEDLTSG